VTLLRHIPASTGELVVEGRLTVKVGADTTGGVYTCMRGHTPPGKGPPLHVHELEDETFYVLRSTYEMHWGDEVITVEPGACLYLPRHTPHTFVNVGDGPGELLEVMTPGGLDKYFHAIEHLGAVADDLPARNEIGSRYGLAFFADLDEFPGPPEGATARPLVVRSPREGRIAELDGHDAVCKMERGETAGSHELHEVRLEPGESLVLPASGGPHLCAVLDGELAVSARDERARAGVWDVVALAGESEPVLACVDGRPTRFLLFSMTPSA
jgi:mannose-6-phosphate isomerase-like protein (cupin superfamily)